MFKSRKEKPKAMEEANDEKEGSHMKDTVVFSTGGFYPSLDLEDLLEGGG